MLICRWNPIQILSTIKESKRLKENNNCNFNGKKQFLKKQKQVPTPKKAKDKDITSVVAFKVHYTDVYTTFQVDKLSRT